MALVEEALCRAVEHGISRLCELIQLGLASSTRSDTRLRDALFELINLVPLTSKPAFQSVADHGAHAFVLFYERVRLRRDGGGHFLEGVPEAVALFSGVRNISMADVSNFKKLKVRDVLSDRHITVDKLENMQASSATRAEVCTSNRSSCDACVPGPVAVLVSRCRAVCQALQSAKRNQLFIQCNNANCNRVFYTGESTEAWCLDSASSSAAACATDDIDGEMPNSVAYWETASSRGLQVASVRRFCCRACLREFDWHLASQSPLCGIELDADNCASKAGRARVGQALKHCLKRNELVARRMRSHRAPRQLAVAKEEMARQREACTAALNVDIGVLVASAAFAESSMLSRNKLLPGAVMYWRDDTAYYAKAVKIVQGLYASAKRREGVISSLLTSCTFLDRVRANAHRMF